MEIRNKITQKLNLPEDVLEGLPVVTVTGKREIYVENYRGIIEYGKNCIRIQTKICRLTFSGQNLEIDYYTNADMKISGDLETISYS